MWVRPSGSRGASGGHRRKLPSLVLAHEGADASFGLRPHPAAVPQLSHKVRVVQRRPAEGDGRHGARGEELLDVGSQRLMFGRHTGGQYVGHVLPSTAKRGTSPTILDGAVLWEVTHMEEEGDTPLQRALKAAIARSGKTRNHFDTLIQKRTGTTGKPIFDIIRRKSRNPSLDTLRTIAEVLDVPLSALTGGVSDSLEDEDAVSKGHTMGFLQLGEDEGGAVLDLGLGGDDYSVDIIKLDLSLSMGPGTLIDDYVEETVYKFDPGLLHMFTRSPPSRLRLVTGIGDSMYPTLSHGDTILIDTTERMLSRQDGIYWINLHGAAGLKRLRTIGRGRILVKSDNPTVGDQEVDAEDLRIDGRVIWYMRGL